MNTDPRLSRRAATLACVGVAGLVAEHAANGEPTAPSAKPIVVKLKESHDSRISGTATLTAAARNRVRVVLRLRGSSLNNLPAHIHTGTCKREPTFANPRIWSGLRNVRDGKSVTTLLRTSMASVRARVLSINVHRATNYGVVACGDIPRTP